MKYEIKNLRQRLERKKGEQTQIKKSLDNYRQKSKSYKRSLICSQKAQAVIHEVAKKTQEELQYHISDLVSLAMSSIFPDPYVLKCDFVSKRGKIEAEMFFEKNGNLTDPLTSTGGGVVDVASLALRFSFWVLKNPRTRPVILMDEPLKWLKGEGLPEKGSEMIKKISKKLKLQIIMVSHDPDLINSADKIIEVNIQKGVSYVR